MLCKVLICLLTLVLDFVQLLFVSRFCGCLVSFVISVICSVCVALVCVGYSCLLLVMVEVCC